MSGFVVADASLAVKWLVQEPDSEKAFALAHSWARSGLRPCAPYLMPVEVASALYRRVRQGELALRSAARLLDALADAGIELREPPGLHASAVALAAQLQLDMVYDAHYLALAEAIDCELWTADERFYSATNPQYKRVRWLRSFL